MANYTADEMDQVLYDHKTSGTTAMDQQFTGPPTSIKEPGLYDLLHNNPTYDKDTLTLTPIENVLGEEDFNFFRTYENDEVQPMWKALRDHCVEVDPGITAKFFFEIRSPMKEKEEKIIVLLTEPPGGAEVAGAVEPELQITFLIDLPDVMYYIRRKP